MIFEKSALFIKKIDTVYRKIGTVYQKIGVKIRFDHLRFFSLRRIFEHWLVVPPGEVPRATHCLPSILIVDLVVIFHNISLLLFILLLNKFEI
jgi:hypothetical protein